MISYYKNFILWDVQKEDGFKEFLYWYTKDAVGINEIPAGRIIDILFGSKTPQNAKCKTVILETEYFDKDYIEAYSRFYSKNFDDINKKCFRFHFFSEKLKRENLIDLEKFNDSYLGYSVLRPIKARKIGRTIIRPLVENENKEFFLGGSTFDVNIAGSKLSINGVPFMEQDTGAAACASAALWVATNSMRHHFGTRTCSTAEITELATKYDLSGGRPMPSLGLTSSQMLKALEALGYDPIIYDRPKTFEAKETIYRYIESEIPVIILFSHPKGHHAMTVVGHTFDTSITPRGIDIFDDKNKRTVIANLYSNTEWIPEFFVHDDQRGPYRRMKFLDINNFLDDEGLIDTAKFPLPKGTNYPAKELVNCPISIDISSEHTRSSDTLVGNIYGIVVPLPKGVTLPAEDAYRKAMRLICLSKKLNGSPNFDDIVLRTYLIPSNKYKEKLQESQLVDAIKYSYRGRPLPKYIWITEISKPDWIIAEKAEERLMHGEILIDCTDNPWTIDFLSIHVPGYYIPLDKSVSKRSTALKALRNPIPIIGDDPYPHLVRKFI